MKKMVILIHFVVAHFLSIGQNSIIISPRDSVFQENVRYDLRYNLNLDSTGKFAEKIYKIPNLWRIDVYGVDLRDLKEGAFFNSALNSAKFSNINKFPYELCKCYQLKKLVIDGSSMIAFPTCILSKNEQLSNLQISNSQLSTIPSEIGNLSKLEILIFNGNKLEKLPKDIKKLKLLKSINLSYNNFERIPLEIFELEGLEALTFEGNDLVEISSEISKLKNLKYLNLISNNLTSLPKTIVELTKLESLMIFGNSISKMETQMLKEKMPNCDIINDVF